MKRLARILSEHELPIRLMVLLQRLHKHFSYLDEQIKEMDKELIGQFADDDLGGRLLSIPYVCPITASLLAAEVGDGKQYGCSRDFAASVVLVPRQHSTGGEATPLGISKRGDKNLRRLLVQCARVYMLKLKYRMRSINPTCPTVGQRFIVASLASSSTAAELRSLLLTRRAAVAQVHGAATYKALGR